MIDYKIRKNSKLIIIISKQESENQLLMQVLKYTLESFGLDISNVSFGFYEGKVTEKDLETCPIINGLLFSQNVKIQVYEPNGKEIHCLPNLYSVALSIQIQEKELKVAAQSLQKRL